MRFQALLSLDFTDFDRISTQESFEITCLAHDLFALAGIF